MDNNKESTCPFTDINGLVATFLEDVAERPVPRLAQRRLREIREAVTKGIATIDMALDIISLFPDRKSG